MQNFYIADATYENETTGKKTLIICKSDKIACKPRILTDNSHIFLSYKDVLANLIMKLAATKTLPTEFYFEEERYTLISYRPYQEEFIFNDYRPKKKRKSQLVNIPRSTKIVVYVGRCRCPRCYPKYGFSSIENICGEVYLKNKPGKTIEIDIQRCDNCGVYFIDLQSLIAYEKKYGKLNIIQKPMSTLVGRDNIDGIFAPDSILSRWGYYARDGFDDNYRQSILAGMIDSGIRKAQIKDKLTEFIQYRGLRCHNAVLLWQTDLEFVNNYGLSKEERIRFQ